MITVSRRSTIEATTPEEVFTALSDPDRISHLLPRMKKVEILNRDMEARTARLVTYMSMGGIFGTIRCEGDLTWEEPSDIVFKVRTPLPLETQWTLTPAINGTELYATMSLDLEPMLGAMTAFVPTQVVSDILGHELDAALKSISERTAGQKLRAKAVAA